MRKLLLTAGLAASLGVAGAADVASAHTYHRYEAHRHECRYERNRNGRIGAVSGTVGGGIIGNAVSHGSAGGTLLGMGLGALTGHALARASTHC
jgi:opacity protein-like surface antigen